MPAPAPYSGNPTGIQSPSPQPVGGGVPIFNIPGLGDRGADFATQALKAAADWIAFLAAQPLATPSGQLLRKTVLTSVSVSPLAKATGCRRAHVRMVAGGGGGGGSGGFFFGGGAGNSVIDLTGGGGSAGGYAEYFTTTIPATWVYAIGAGGAAGTAIPGDGGNGGNTTFSDGVMTVTAFGGNGGGAGGTIDIFTNGLSGLPGLSPPLSTNGTINCSGAFGGWGSSTYSFNGTGNGGTVPASGGGGSSLLGGVGGKPVRQAGTAGNPGIGFGAGGSGSFNLGSGNTFTFAGIVGGAGSAGAIILEEYS